MSQPKRDEERRSESERARLWAQPLLRWRRGFSPVRTSIRQEADREALQDLRTILRAYGSEGEDRKACTQRVKDTIASLKEQVEKIREQIACAHEQRNQAPSLNEATIDVPRPNVETMSLSELCTLRNNLEWASEQFEAGTRESDLDHNQRALYRRVCDAIRQGTAYDR